jgi:hypothetical protein
MKKMRVAALMMLGSIVASEQSMITNKQIITAEVFEESKKALPDTLKILVDDFSKWDIQDKKCVGIYGLHLFISDLNPAIQARYGGSLMLWMGKNAKNLSQRAQLLSCLKYLKQESKK